jgi:hypothetical protein
MEWFLYIMSIYFIMAGVILILYTDWLKKLLQTILKDLNVKWFFPLPLIIGALFIFSGDLLPYPWFAIVIGFLVIGKGCYLLFLPGKKIEATIHWWTHKVDDITYRFLGIIILVLGTTLLSWL